MPSAVMTTRRSSGRASACDDKRVFPSVAGSMPLDLSTAAASGPERYLISSLRRVLVFRRRAQAGGIGGGVLDFLRQRADQRHAFHRHDLADLVDAEFGFAADDEIGDMAALLELGLRLDLVGDAELHQQLVDIDAARAAARRIDIGDRLGREQRLLELVDRADVRLGRALLHHHADADAGEIDLAAGGELAARDHFVDHGRGDHQDVEGFAAFDALLQLRRWCRCRPSPCGRSASRNRAPAPAPPA